MDIETRKTVEPGTKIWVTEWSANIIAGRFAETDKIRRHLELRKPYTVERTRHNASGTEVWLKEVPGVSFDLQDFEKVK
jgi:hypothetical protein